MSLAVENILYVGRNIELVEALLTSVKVDNEVSYNTDHKVCANEVLQLLSEKKYHHFIIEEAIPKVVRDKIQLLFPDLKTTYLQTPLPINSSFIAPSMDELVSENIKKSLNCISIPIYYKDKDSKIIVCNNSFADHLGLTVDDVIGKSSADILPPSMQKELALVDKKMFDDRKVHLYECELHDTSGNSREVVFRKEFIASTDIQIGIVFDVSDLNEARRSIEKEHIMLRAATDLSPDLIFFKDKESRFLGCNKQFEKFIGQTEANIIGKRDEQFFELEQAIMCQRQDQGVLANTEIYSGEEHLTYVDGERHFIDMKKVPLLDNKDKVRGLIGIGRDITAHHRLQKRLKVANTVFENSQENILVTNQKGKIVSINHAACELFGYSKIELLDKPVMTLSAQAANALLFKDISKKLSADEVWKGDITYRNKNNEIRFAWLEIYIVELEEGVNNRIYTFTDLSQNKNIERKIQFLSKHDPLTGLSNRIALFTKLEDAIHRTNFNETTMAVLLIDINGFKVINDQYGHNEGDKILQEIACRLKNCVSEKDTLARFGDHEFVIIIDDLNNEHDAALVAQQISDQFSNAFNIGNIDAKLRVTIGISLSPDDGIDVDTLLQSAEKAMLRAKLDKGCAYRFYTDQLTEYSSNQLQLEAELKVAIEKDQFELYYQPQYDLNKKLIIAMEGLLRWHHPRYGLLFPDRFLSLAEESGLIIPLGLKVLEKVALQTVRWRKSNIFFGRIAVEISIKQLEQISLIADIQTILKDTACLASDIELEVLASIFSSDNYTIHENLFNIHKLGIAITISGFGADTPVFHFIEPLGVDKFKISENYIQHISGQRVGQAMLNSVQVLARDLGVDIVGKVMDCIDQNRDSQVLSGDDYQSKAMKVSEATFYLRCHKKK